MNHRIKEFREMLGLSQKDFGKALGIPHVQILRFEKGRSNPTFETIEKIATTFQVNPSWLIGWSENIKPNNKPIRICYIADGPSRIPPYLDTDCAGHTIRWKQTKKPYIGKRGGR